VKLYVKPGCRYRINGKEHGPGEVVDVPDKLVGVLTHPKGPLQRQASTAESEPAPNDIAALRLQYREVIGRGPFMGWDAATLREKIGQYRTTHLIAQK
jgi:hypothetical protein